MYRVLYTGYSRQVGNRTFYFRRRRSRLRPSRHPSILHGDSDLLLRALGRRLRGSCGSGSSHARTQHLRRAASQSLKPAVLPAIAATTPWRFGCRPPSNRVPIYKISYDNLTGAAKGGGEHAPPRNWVYKKIPGCAVELNTQDCARFGSQISYELSGGYMPPEPPTRGSVAGPRWGTSVPPDSLCRELRSTCDGRLIYETSYEGRKAFLRYAFTRKIVRSSETVFVN